MVRASLEDFPRVRPRCVWMVQERGGGHSRISWWASSIMCVGMCISAVARGGQKRALDPLELQLQVDISQLTWVLRTGLWYS